MKKNINRFTFSPITYYNDGGIHSSSISLHPSWRTVEHNSWIIHKIRFKTCNTIPVSGAITIQPEFNNINNYA